MQMVTMYTTAVCPYCIQAKRLLQSKGVAQIEEIRVDTQPDDRAVDKAYAADAKALGAKSTWNSDRERVAFLFELYQRLTSLVPTAPG